MVKIILGKKSVMIIFTFFFIVFSLLLTGYSSSKKETYLIHERDTISLTHACSYYKLYLPNQNFGQFKQALDTLDISKIKEVYGRLHNLSIEILANESYEVRVPIYGNISANSTCNTSWKIFNETKGTWYCEKFYEEFNETWNETRRCLNLSSITNITYFTVEKRIGQHLTCAEHSYYIVVPNGPSPPEGMEYDENYPINSSHIKIVDENGKEIDLETHENCTCCDIVCHCYNGPPKFTKVVYDGSPIAKGYCKTIGEGTKLCFINDTFVSISNTKKDRICHYNYTGVIDYENKTRYRNVWKKLADYDFKVSKEKWKENKNRYRKAKSKIKYNISNLEKEVFDSFKEKNFIEVRICGNYDFEATPNGWGIAIDHIPTYLGVEYSAYDWWNTSWQYRRPINITEQSGNTLTDYQVLITIDTASLISEGKMRSDCGDIRFTDSSDNELSYWIESGCNSANTKIWVKVPSIPASSTATIYVYYGNPSATSESNGTAVFDFFDDFEDGVYDTNKWIEPVGGPGTYSETNGYLELHVTGTDAPYRALTNTFTMSDGIVEQKIMWVSTTATPHIMIFVRQPTDGTYGYGELTARGGGGDDLYFHDGATKGKVTLGYNFDSYSNTWFFMRFKLSGSNAWGYLKNLDTGVETTTSITNFATLTSPGRLGPGVWNVETVNRVDWFRVRKYASAEPTYEIGEEETANQPPSVDTLKTYDENYAEQTSFSGGDKVIIRVNVTDPQGASDIDKVLIEIIDNSSVVQVSNETMTKIGGVWYSDYSDWQYRKQINITEQSGNTLTDYQVALNITYDSNMQSDFDDIRFTYSNASGEYEMCG